MTKQKLPLLLAVAGVLIIVLASLFLGDSKYLASAKLGGEYLISHMYEDGSFVYEYDPESDSESDSYNILRHAGTTYALLELYEATNNKRYLTGAERALDYLRKATIPCPVYKDALCVLEDNEIKLGGNGLALLAFTKYMELTDSRDDQALAEGIATFISAIQAKNGEFLFYKMDAKGVPDSDFVSEYYPGEAMFGLARLSELTNDATWMTTAHKGADWIINVRDKDVATNDLPHDHWMLYALNELYADEQKQDYLEHTKRLVNAILAAQHQGLTGEQEEWNGGYYNPPRSTPTATRNEGLGAAYRIFMRSGDAAYTAITKDAMERGIEFTLRTQFTSSKLRELNFPREALGGFHEGLDDYDIRIDYVQHNISALLAFDRIENGK
ncbi:MAG: hypothetical protein KBD16_00025 [Candidatus Pacebacteria bacterium]|nr:hypothetical protein [Candidatus Paceibacterota bacterium]